MNIAQKRTDTEVVTVTGAVNEFEVPMRPTDVADEVSVAHGIPGAARDHSSIVRTGDLVIDLKTRAVSVNDQPVRLTRKEYCILELLNLRKGTIVTKEMVLSHLYDGKYQPDLKILDIFVCHLRKKLGQATGGKHCIETIWGRGYRLRDPAQVPPPHT
jgi:two-component system cell cycle response regulator CtrA